MLKVNNLYDYFSISNFKNSNGFLDEIGRTNKSFSKFLRIIAVCITPNSLPMLKPKSIQTTFPLFKIIYFNNKSISFSVIFVLLKIYFLLSKV